MNTTDDNDGQDAAPAASGRVTFEELMTALDQAAAHPDAILVQHRKGRVMAQFLAEGEAKLAARTSEQQRLDEIGEAMATVAQHAWSDGRRALEAGDLAAAAAQWRIAAVLSDPATEEILGEESVVLHLIEVYLRLNRPHLAQAWCTIAADAGLPLQRVHPLLARAWKGLTADRDPAR